MQIFCPIKVVRNLLSNALKFTGTDGNIQVTVTRYRELANIDLNHKGGMKGRVETSDAVVSGSFNDNAVFAQIRQVSLRP